MDSARKNHGIKRRVSLQLNTVYAAASPQPLREELQPPALNNRGVKRRGSLQLDAVYAASPQSLREELQPPALKLKRRGSLLDAVYAASPQPLREELQPPNTNATCANTDAPRVGSRFTRRTSVFPSKSDKRPVAVHMFNFYRELRSICSLKPSTEFNYPCFNTAEPSMDPEQMAAVEWLQSLAQEGDLEELQFQLFKREMQRLNPSLEEGCLFVDGLYELVCSRMPLDARMGEPPKRSVRDLLTVYNSGTLLLQRYWHRPDDPQEYGAYLTVASSFVEYILASYSSEGVSQFLQKLDCSMVDPQAENFRFKRKDVLTLEFKWKKFAEAQVNVKCRLSTVGMLRVLFRQHLLTYWLQLLAVFLIVLVDVGLHLILAISAGRLMSFGYTPSSILPILQWVGILLGSIFLRFGVMVVSTVIQASVAVKVSNKFRKQLSARLHEVTAKFLMDHSTGSILTTFVQDVNYIEIVVAYALRTVVWGSLMVLTLIVFTLVLAWPIGIPLALIFIVSQLLVNFISARLNNHAFAKSQATNKLSDIMKEQIDGFAVNRLYRLSAFWQSQMAEAIRMYYSLKARRSLFLTAFILLCQQLVPKILNGLLTFGLILLVQYNWLEFEIGLAIFVLFYTVVVAMAEASSMFPHIQAAGTAMGRIRALLYDEQHSDQNGENTNDYCKDEHGDESQGSSLPVEFKSVCFSYNTAASHWNLYDVSVKINAGERVAIVGKSGSGKTTFLSLVLQMLRPVHGEVAIGEGSTTGCANPKVAATFQHNHIFNMSIRENIRISNLRATNGEVETAARLADIHSWILSLPRGYDTAVHAGGGSLSGGQKQRIAIARMLVAKAPVLVLDEVTSALDPSTESRVFVKLMEVTEGKTVIASTHHLTQAQQFDRVIVLSHGKLAEIGTHEELLALQGTYWQMWHSETADSPGVAVPITRRRSSISFLPPELPELSIVPLSCARNTPMPHIDHTRVATPAFVALHTLLEAGESGKDSALSRSAVSADEKSAVTIPEAPVPVNFSTPRDECSVELGDPVVPVVVVHSEP